MRSLLKVAKAIYPVAAVALAMGAALYILALIALNDHARQVTAGALTHESAAIAPTVKADETVHALDPHGVAMAAGHRAPLATVDVTGDGGVLLSTSTDGTVRLTRLNAAYHLDVGLSDLAARLRERVWAPLAGPLAERSLWLVSQVAPLYVPEMAKGRRGRTFRDCAGCPEMVEIAPGMFFREGPQGWTVGSRELTHVRRSFAVGRFPVTFDQWDACVKDGACGGYRPSDQGWGRGRRPVINVSWHDATAYIQWLSAKTGRAYRLLTDLEREFVTRAGATTRYSWGDSVGAGLANCDGCGSRWDGVETAPVGAFRPNPFGLYDTHGNVGEWTGSCRADAEAPDAAECPLRIVRGGSWASTPNDLRSARFLQPGARGLEVGFRVARDPK